MVFDDVIARDQDNIGFGSIGGYDEVIDELLDPRVVVEVGEVGDLEPVEAAGPVVEGERFFRRGQPVGARSSGRRKMSRRRLRFQ